jgi:thioesterase domain-containing protein
MWHFPDHQVPMLEAHQKAIDRYSPRPTKAPVALFLPRTEPLFGPWFSVHARGWQALAGGGVEAHLLPGSHATILSGRYARALARSLNAAIERIERESPSADPVAASAAGDAGRRARSGLEITA